MKEGLTTEWHPDGTFERGNYVNAVRDGEWVLYRADGAPVEKKHYIAGELHGIYVRYGLDGEPVLAGKYKAGERDGMWLQWNAGEREFTLYSDGKPGDVGGFSHGLPVRYRYVCMVARSAPFCRSVLFMDAQLSFGWPFERVDFPLDLDVGAVVNTGRDGFGFSTSASARFVRAHYRRYLTDFVYLSLSPGWRRGENGGFTAKTTINMGNLFGAGFEYRRVRATEEYGNSVYLFIAEVGVGACLARAFLFQPCSSQD